MAEVSFLGLPENLQNTPSFQPIFHIASMAQFPHYRAGGMRGAIEKGGSEVSGVGAQQQIAENGPRMGLSKESYM